MAPSYPNQPLPTVPRPSNNDLPHTQLAQSDLVRIAYSNNAPNAPDTSLLQQEVGTLVPMVSLLRNQLKETEEGVRLRKSALSPTRRLTKMASLSVRLKAAEERLLLCKLALSPIRRLPPELLGEIFNALLGMVRQEEKRRTLVRLGQVCKAWNPPLHDPSHWAKTTLRLSDKNSFRTSMDIEAHFRGAGDLPRSITLEGEGCPCGNPSERKKWWYCQCGWRVAVTELLYRPTKIRRLVLARSSFRCFTNLMASLHARRVTGPRAWSSVESMELDFLSFGALGQVVAGEDGPPRSKTKITLDFLDLPPSLTYLTLKLPQLPTNFKTGFDLETQCLNNLTSLSIYCDWDTPDVLLVLLRCPNLRSLLLDFNKSPHTWKCTIDHITLPQLRSLDITIRNYCAAAKILPLFVLPMLEDLRLFVDFTHDDRELKRRLTHLKIFRSGSPSGPPLSSLTIHSCTVMGLKRKINVEFLVSILSNIPSLRSFTLDRVFFDAQGFVEVLRERTQSGGPGVFPEIRSLQLLDVDGGLDVFDINAFLQCVTLLRRPSRGATIHGAGRPPDGLRTILFGYSDRILESEDRLEKRNHQFELASKTIDLLQNSYHVVVDRLFTPDRGH